MEERPFFWDKPLPPHSFSLSYISLIFTFFSLCGSLLLTDRWKQSGPGHQPSSLYRHAGLLRVCKTSCKTSISQVCTCSSLSLECFIISAQEGFPKKLLSQNQVPLFFALISLYHFWVFMSLEICIYYCDYLINIFLTVLQMLSSESISVFAQLCVLWILNSAWHTVSAQWRNIY